MGKQHKYVNAAGKAEMVSFLDEDIDKFKARSAESLGRRGIDLNTLKLVDPEITVDTEQIQVLANLVTILDKIRVIPNVTTTDQASAVNILGGEAAAILKGLSSMKPAPVTSAAPATTKP